MAPEEQRDLLHILRYRNFLVREAVKMKIKTASLLMEVGAEYSKAKLHGTRYFQELLSNLDYVPESVLSLLQMTRSNMECFQKKVIAIEQRLSWPVSWWLICLL